MTEPATDQGFTRKVFVVVGIVALVVVFLALVYFTFDVLLLIFGAVLLAVFIRGLADLLAKYTPIPESLSVLTVTLLLVLLLVGAVTLLAPDVENQAVELRQKLPESAMAAAATLGQYGWGRALLEQLPTIDEVRAQLDAGTLLSGVGGFFTSTIGAVGNFFITLMLGVYLAIEPRTYVRGFTNLFPRAGRTRARQILFAAGDTLRWWLIGKVGSMLAIGVLTWIGLSIIGVPLALTLALLAGLLSFVPNFGPIISAIPAILLGFIDSPRTAVYVIALYIGVQIIESYLITPWIERKTVEIPPALTIVFQLALAVMVGGMGLVLATPLLALVLVVIQKVYIEDVLHDRKSTA